MPLASSTNAVAVDYNYHPYSTQGMVVAMAASFIMFVCLVFAFEISRYYKQIYLKRLQQRFIETNRVPPEPPDSFLGWLLQTMRVPERGICLLIVFSMFAVC
jgi:hypothetical protein